MSRGFVEGRVFGSGEEAGVSNHKAGREGKIEGRSVGKAVRGGGGKNSDRGKFGRVEEGGGRGRRQVFSKKQNRKRT